MSPRTSKHAAKRRRQRAIPPVVERWLDEFGELRHDGRGGIINFFSHRSVRAMASHLGMRFLQQNRKYLGVYRVLDSHDHSTITMGWLYRRVGNR